MKTAFLVALALGSLWMGLHVREIPLYVSRITWSGGQMRIQTYYDRNLGVQKRIVDSQ